MTTVFRVVIDEDINQFDPKDYQDYVKRMNNQNINYPTNPPRFPVKSFPDWANDVISMTKREAEARTYNTKRSAKAKLTMIKRYSNTYGINGWVEEAAEIVWKRV